MIWFVVGYLVIATNGMICLRACHLRPYGVRCTWRGLWMQLNYRKPRLPTAIVRWTTNLANRNATLDGNGRVYHLHPRSPSHAPHQPATRHPAVHRQQLHRLPRRSMARTPRDEESARGDSLCAPAAVPPACRTAEAVMTPPVTLLSDGRILSPLATDANWHAIRVHRERHCVCPMTPAHWDVVNLCDRALRDYSDHEAWEQVIAQIGGGS